MKSSLPFVRRAAAVCAALAGLLCLSPAARAADPKKGVTVEEIEYKGWKHNLRISNGDAELIVTLDVGPRIISYKLKGGKNVFKEFEEQLGKSGEKDWQIRGGTRLWVGPEDVTRTYFPDNGPVKYSEAPQSKEQEARRSCSRRRRRRNTASRSRSKCISPPRAAPSTSPTASPTSASRPRTWRRGCRR